MKLLTYCKVRMNTISRRHNQSKLWSWTPWLTHQASRHALAQRPLLSHATRNSCLRSIFYFLRFSLNLRTPCSLYMKGARSGYIYQSSWSPNIRGGKYPGPSKSQVSYLSLPEKFSNRTYLFLTYWHYSSSGFLCKIVNWKKQSRAFEAFRNSTKANQTQSWQIFRSTASSDWRMQRPVVYAAILQCGYIRK